MRPISEVIIHCSATRPEWMKDLPLEAKIAEIRIWHKARGWRDIGYHYLIDRDGGVLPGRPVGITGAHVKGHNTGTIGVCLIGGHGSAETDNFNTHFTVNQDAALRGLIGELLREYGDIKVSGHNEYAAKACPGFNVTRWLSMLPPKPTKPAPEPQTLWGVILAAIAALFLFWRKK